MQCIQVTYRRSGNLVLLCDLTGLHNMKYCESRNFRAVHIFALFAFSENPRKYVQRENNLYIET